MLKIALITSLVIAKIIYVVTFTYADGIIRIFNSEGSIEIARMAKIGLRIYCIGFFFAGINIIVAMYLSATESAKDAFLISIARGCVIIVPMVLLLSNVWEMTGIWLAFLVTEAVMAMFSICRQRRITY